jgi:SCP-2 sterol transfer family
MAKFLSDEWFGKYKQLTDDAGELNIPGPLKDLTININVSFADGAAKPVHLVAGVFAQGAATGAPVTVSVPADVAKKIFIDMDQAAGMQAFMSGQMKVDGDVSKLMVLQSVKPSDQQRDLLDDVKAITD